MLTIWKLQKPSAMVDPEFSVGIGGGGALEATY